MSNDRYRYSLRFVDGYEKEVIAHDDEIEKGLITFMDQDGGWFYRCSIKNLVDMEVELYEETQAIVTDHAQTVLPKEHT